MLAGIKDLAYTYDVIERNGEKSLRFVDWIGLDWIGLDWIGLDWIGLDWIRFVAGE